jgi:hypothetical protein
MFFGEVLKLFQSIASLTPVATKEATLTSVGFLLMFNLLDTAIRFNEFHRTDEDNLSIAWMYCLGGRFAEALSALDRIKLRTSPLYTMRGVAHLGVLQYKRAWEDTAEALRLGQDPAKRLTAHESITPADTLYQLLSLTSFLKVPAASLVGTLGLGSEKGVQDMHLANSLTVCFPEGNIPEAVHLSLSKIADVGNRPMFRVVLLLGMQKFDEAGQALSKVQPAGFTEEFFCDSLALLFKINNPTTSLEQDRTTFSEWSDGELKKMDQADWGSLRPLEVGLIYGKLLNILNIAEAISPDYVQPWQHVLNEFRKIMSAKHQMPFDRLQDWVKGAREKK